MRLPLFPGRFPLRALAILAAALGRVPAQPAPAPVSGDAVCEAPPAQALEPDRSAPDSEGFYPLFNGIDFAGWWLDCGTLHSQSGPEGPIFRVDKERKALYSTQRGTAIGGVLMTKARFADYEIVFDYWPDWGNSAALLNRSDSAGRAYATTLGYFSSTSLGGVWGEAGFTARDFRPFSFGAAESTIVTPGSSAEVRSWWTRLTSDLKARGESFPCPETGCTEADWRRLWDFDGWNQIRILFHGGRRAGDAVHARTWFRKPGADVWVPLEVDTTLVMEIPPGYIGLRVHGGGAYGGARGTWYRNLRWRPWDPPASGLVRGPSPEVPRPVLIRMDPGRQGIRIAFADGKSRHDLQVFSVDGEPIADARGVRGEAFLKMTGRARGLYLLRTETGGRHEWLRFILP